MPTLDSNEELDDILDRFRRGCDTDFDISIRYGRTKEETKQTLLVREKQLIEAAVREALVNELTDLWFGKFTNHLFQHMEYCVPTKDIAARIKELNQPTKEGGIDE